MTTEAVGEGNGGRVDVGTVRVQEPPRFPEPLGWPWDELGLEVEIFDDAYGVGLHGLLGLALRRNPRRAHLLVSRVLGKHLPVQPARALHTGALLARQVSARLGELAELDHRADVGSSAALAGAPLVIGFCETATALGHTVADGLPGADYLHTTRRPVAGTPPLLTFVEAHSHATEHWLMPADPALVRHSRPLVLVDDELSTGDTALGTIRALHAYAPKPSYTVATLFDARPASARAAFDDLADTLGVPVGVVSLLSGTVRVPPDITERARRLRGRLGGVPAAGNAGTGGGTGGRAPHFPARQLALDWPARLPDGARHGWDPAASALLEETLPAIISRLAAELSRPGGTTLVVGTEELMYTPMRIAAALAEAVGGEVLYQSTTRSPVHTVDVAGYAIRTALTFRAPDGPARDSHIYNVAPGRYDDIVVVVDAGAAGAGLLGPADLAEKLRRYAPVTVAAVPSFVPAVGR